MQGIHTAVVTPFTPDGELDLPAYERLIDGQIRAGVQGIVACGTTGETPTLTGAEWEELVRAAVRVADGRVPVTAGVGTNDTRSTVANTRRARELGANAGLLVFPYYNKPNPAGHRLHVRAAADVGLPLVLYHVPGRTGQRLTPAAIAELAAVPGVVGIKEATGDLLFGGELLTRTRVPVLSGDDFTFLPLLAMGGAGCISVVSNVAPATTVRVWRAFSEGRTAEARQAMHDLWPLVAFLFSESNPIPCKAALAAKGVCGPHVRAPLAPFEGVVPRELLGLP